MGSGKTSAMLHKIKRDYGLRFIYVTPYLDEIDRIIDATQNFVQPKDIGNGKLDALHNLLVEGRNIATTHAL